MASALVAMVSTLISSDGLQPSSDASNPEMRERELEPTPNKVRPDLASYRLGLCTPPARPCPC